MNTDSNDTLNEILNPYLTQLISLNHNAIYNIKNCFNYFTNRTLLWRQIDKNSLMQLLCTVSLKQTEIHKDISNWLGLINAIYIKQKEIYEKQLKDLLSEVCMSHRLCLFYFLLSINCFRALVIRK